MARRQPPAGGEPDEVADLTQAMSGRAMLGLGRRPIRIKIVRFYIATARLFSAEVFGILPFSE